MVEDKLFLITLVFRNFRSFMNTWFVFMLIAGFPKILFSIKHNSLSNLLSSFITFNLQKGVNFFPNFNCSRTLFSIGSPERLKKFSPLRFCRISLISKNFKFKFKFKLLFFYLFRYINIDKMLLLCYYLKILY